MIDLRDLLKHELMDLYSAEEQIIEAMPSMIEKANTGTLKTALKEHLKVTEKQKARLEEIQKLMGESQDEANAETGTNFFSRLFGGGGTQKCKGMEGLISEGEKMMGEDMSPEVLDALIIASAQKIEHYEICGYGTARAFARELNLGEVANKLGETLNEEYYADDLLTELAVGKLNVEAEFAEESENKGRRLRTGQARSGATSNGSGKSSNARGAASNGRGTTAKSNRGSNAKTKSGGTGRSGTGKGKSTQSKSASSSRTSSSAPAKRSASRSSGRTIAASDGRGKPSAKSTSQASSKKSASKSSSGSNSKSVTSRGSRRR